jgi:hypothetical protein
MKKANSIVRRGRKVKGPRRDSLTAMKNITFLILISLIICSGRAYAQAQLGSNIALNKTYTLSPAPNYALCSNDPQHTLLTDGKYTTGYFWTQQTTVGWQNSVPVTITFDLGSEQPISGISYNTAAGTAGVMWPEGIVVLVSDDELTWHYAGDVIDLNDNPSPPSTPYSIYQYKTTKLETHGRYVQLMVTPIASESQFVFIDEIGIYQGNSNLLAQTLPGPAITDTQSFYQNNYLPDMRMEYRLNQDLNNVTQELANTNLSPTMAGPLNSTLTSIAVLIPQTTINSLSTFTTVFPENDSLGLHRQIFAVQAGIWRAMGLSGVVVSSANRWDPVSPTSPPVAGNAYVDVSMMSNEYRAGALNLSNSGENPTSVSFSIGGLPGGTNPSYISVYEVPFTDTQEGNPVAAALVPVPLQNNLYVVAVPSGLTHQIWFSFNPTQIAAGDYSGTIQLLIDGVTSSVPLHFKIYPLQFPSKPTLHVGGWDYIFSTTANEYTVTNQNRNALLQTLSSHFVDTTWSELSVMQTGKYNADGSMKTPPSITPFNNWLALWPKARNYFVFMNAQTTFAGFNINTPAWTNAVTAWITWWVNHLPSNINLGMLIVDEPYTQAQDNIIIPYASVIKAAAPQVQIFEDVSWSDPTQADPALFNESNILSPNAQYWINNNQLSNGESYDNFYVNEENLGHDLWVYNAQGPTRTFDPYTYYLGQEWLAWKYGDKGTEFWAFTDVAENGGNSWNEYTLTSGLSYTPLFIDSTSVTLGKHMEAIREGVEDYEYLRMLHDETVQLTALGVQNSILTSSEVLLTNAPDLMLAGMNSTTWPLWSAVKDRTVQDQLRVEILDALVQLNQIDPRNAPALSLGDVNNDKSITIADAELVAQSIVGVKILTTAQQTAAEVSSSTETKPTIYDAFLIAEYAAGLISKFPAS